MDSHFRILSDGLKVFWTPRVLLSHLDLSRQPVRLLGVTLSNLALTSEMKHRQVVTWASSRVLL